MVTIQRIEDYFLFEVKGMHKFWAFKSEIKIPCEHVLKAYQDETMLKGFKGFRFPGTSLPGVIHAGTYLKDGGKNFWDVSHKANAIIIDLKDEEYNHLIIEVENPVDAIAVLNKG
jgi:hypothetical protein